MRYRLAINGEVKEIFNCKKAALNAAEFFAIKAEGVQAGCHIGDELRRHFTGPGVSYNNSSRDFHIGITEVV